MVKSYGIWIMSIKESQASEPEKIDFSKNEAKKFCVKIDYKTGLIFWKCWNMVIKWPNLESDNSKKSKFPKFRFTAEFRTFFWKENTPYFNLLLKK